MRSLFSLCAILLLSVPVWGQLPVARDSETNASRMKRGLPPLPPRQFFDPSRVRRAAPAASPTPLPRCSAIGSQPMAIELRRSSDDTVVGYVGYQGSGYWNVYYSGYGAGGGGALFGVTRGDRFNAISLPASYGGDFCAQVNQWVTKKGVTQDYCSQDLYHDDNVHWKDDSLNYLFNVACNNPAGYYQEYNYKWDSNGAIRLEWDQPPGVAVTGELFPTLWIRSGSSTFRWYAPDKAPYTPKLTGDWSTGYLRWACQP
ncbi:hypothetical protein FB45DRAFT_417288 [Roridomyces roridus]|uniref:Uncharacterized protein n=1 Tax=Roridomyces roridus TaxID=1738132 RepID=A0AAD7FTZ1_9AGAR|nr:hypothetical protein FB45DRAFT_417288 [Roridomyces roridus]